jgi:hypothetical protein
VLAAGIGALAGAAPAQATLVYVKKPAAENSVVYVAADDASNRRRVGIGRAPAVSPDGNWIAWIGKDDGLDQLMLQRAGGGATLVVTHSKALDAIHFSPDSTMVGAVLSGRRLRVYSIPTDTLVPVGSGFIRGWTFSPDSKTIAWGRAAKSAPESAGDVYTAPVAAGTQQTRLTRTGDALNPLWGAQGVVFRPPAPARRRRAGLQPVVDPGRRHRAAAHHAAEDPAAGERPRPRRSVGRRRPPARRLHGPGHARGLHGRSAGRRDEVACAPRRGWPRGLRPVERRLDDPRPHRRRGPVGCA